jgi:hypothetical protein
MEATGRGAYQGRLEGLVREGRAIRDLLAHDGSSASTAGTVRSWQQACAAIVTQLSGGSKAHWLARAFSDAFLLKSVGGQAVTHAPLAEIVERLVDVLEQAHQSLAQMTETRGASPATAPTPRRFGFVHDASLRPILEQAYVNGRMAFEQEQFAVSLITTSGILEAIITDALQHSGHDSHDWSFDRRIAAATEAGLIRGGCARLPPIARSYRDLTDETSELRAGVTVTAREARVTSEVLHVVMRDLNPGR